MGSLNHVKANLTIWRAPRAPMLEQKNQKYHFHWFCWYRGGNTHQATHHWVRYLTSSAWCAEIGYEACQELLNLTFSLLNSQSIRVRSHNTAAQSFSYRCSLPLRSRNYHCFSALRLRTCFFFQGQYLQVPAGTDCFLRVYGQGKHLYDILCR